MQRVRHGGIDLDEQFDRAPAQARPHDARDRGQQAARVIVGGVRLGAAGLGAGDVEHVAHEPAERLRGVPDHLRQFVLTLGQRGVEQQFGGARDPGQRRLDLVAHRGQELALLGLQQLEARHVAEHPQVAGGAVIAERDVVEAEPPPVLALEEVEARELARLRDLLQPRDPGVGIGEQAPEAREQRIRSLAFELIRPAPERRAARTPAR